MHYQLKSLISVLSLFCGLASSASTQAALYDRGGGLIYDDVLNVTWLQDANYFHTVNNYPLDSGSRVWRLANDWINSLVFYDNIRNNYINGWRLPNVRPSNSVTFNFDYSNSGNTDIGYNIVNSNSEMAYMYYVNLQNQSRYMPDGAINPNWTGVVNTTFLDAGQNNKVSNFENLQSFRYWGNSEGNLNFAWQFDFNDGIQNYWYTLNQGFFWAVHDGDVTAVPLPSSAWLFGSAILGLITFRKKST